MYEETEKCVIVMDEKLPLGILANTAAILGITIGRKLPHVVGQDVVDLKGNTHMGIIRFPVPILKGNQEKLRELRAKLFTPQFADVTAVDFNDLAQSSKTYEEFVEKMEGCTEEKLHYMGIAICGDKKKINKLTGSLPLLK